MHEAITTGTLLTSLGWVVRKQRRRLGLSQEQLAERAGVHRNYVGGVERGEHSIGLVNLAQLALALELSVTELMRRLESEVSVA